MGPCPPCCPAASTHGRGTASVRHSAAPRGPSSRIAHGHGLPATGRAAARRARGGGGRVRGARVHAPEPGEQHHSGVVRAVQRVALQVVILQPTQEERARVDQVVGDLRSAEVAVRVSGHGQD